MLMDWGGVTHAPVPGIADHPEVLTPDDIMAGRLPDADAVLVYDDDHYYLGGVIAQLLADAGKAVTLVTPAPSVSCWTQNTMGTAPHRKSLAGPGCDPGCKTYA